MSVEEKQTTKQHKPWPMFFAVQGLHGSNGIYFHKQSAEKFIAERDDPGKFHIVEYVPMSHISAQNVDRQLAEARANGMREAADIARIVRIYTNDDCYAVMARIAAAIEQAIDTQKVEGLK